jgi:hypothetical protein
MGGGALVSPPPLATLTGGCCWEPRWQRQLCQMEHAHVPVPSTPRPFVAPSAVLLLPSARMHSVLELPPWCRGLLVMV